MLPGEQRALKDEATRLSKLRRQLAVAAGGEGAIGRSGRGKRVAVAPGQEVGGADAAAARGAAGAAVREVETGEEAEKDLPLKGARGGKRARGGGRRRDDSPPPTLLDSDDGTGTGTGAGTGAAAALAPPAPAIGDKDQARRRPAVASSGAVKGTPLPPKVPGAPGRSVDRVAAGDVAPTIDPGPPASSGSSCPLMEGVHFYALDSKQEDVLWQVWKMWMVAGMEDVDGGRYGRCG